MLFCWFGMCWKWLFGGETELTPLVIGFDDHAVVIDFQTTDMHPSAGCQNIPFVTNSKRMVVDDDHAISRRSGETPDRQGVDYWRNNVGRHRIRIGTGGFGVNGSRPSWGLVGNTKTERTKAVLPAGFSAGCPRAVALAAASAISKTCFRGMIISFNCSV